MSFENRIRANLRAAADVLPPPGAVRPWQGEPAPVAHRRRNLTVALGAAFLVVVAVGSVVLVRPTATTLVATGEGISFEWSKYSPKASGINLDQVVAGSDSVLVFGSLMSRSGPGPEAPRVWRSVDGISWEEIETQGLDNQVVLQGSTSWDSGYLIAGLAAIGDYTPVTTEGPSNFPKPAVWNSEDGTTWETTPLPLPDPDDRLSSVVSYLLTGATASDQIAVVAGVELDESVMGPNDDSPGETTTMLPSRTVVWILVDGEWSIATDPPWGEATSAGPVVTGPGGIVVTVYQDDGPSMWLTADGHTWQHLTPGTWTDKWFLALAANQHGYLAATGSESGDEMWFSPTGHTWVPISPTNQPEDVASVSAGPAGFAVSLEDPSNRASLHWSATGNNWRDIGPPKGFGPNTTFARLAITQDSVLVVANEAMWTGRRLP